MSLYYLISAESKCAGKLNTNAWTRRDETRKGERRSGYYYTVRSEKGKSEIGAGEFFPRNEDSRGEDFTEEDLCMIIGTRSFCYHQ